MNEIRVKFIICEDMLYFNERDYFLNSYTTCKYYKKYIFASTKELTNLEMLAVGKYYCHVINNENEEYSTEIKVVPLEEFRKMRGPTYVLIQEKDVEKETDKEYKAFIE